MKKGIIFVLLIVFLVFANISSVYASENNYVGIFLPEEKPFGGEIINDKALEIETLEDSEFICDLQGGESIEIDPTGSSTGTPTSYFIPADVRSETDAFPAEGELILGNYDSNKKTSITCTLMDYSVTVELDTISYYGVSVDPINEIIKMIKKLFA